MPRQNRVTPFGEIIATPERGTLMGNRGCLHDADGRIRRRYVGTRWIYCLLEFRGRRREVMAPGRYTELFFLDETTALAAGHRPCAECQRERYLAFRRCWMAGQERPDTARAPAADELDASLHAERLDVDGRRRTYDEDWRDLPDGTMVTTRHQAYLVHDSGLRQWTSRGYHPPERELPGRLQVLTPRSIVAAIRCGFRAAGP